MWLRNSASVLGSAFLILAAAPAAAAQTYVVDRFDDSAAATACTAAANDCSLRGAVIAANGDGEASTIQLPHGVYQLTIAGAGEDAAATGDLDVTEQQPLTIETLSGYPVIQQTTSDRILDLGLLAGPVTIQGPLTLRGGNVSGNGGAINTYHSGNLTLQSVTIDGNIASGTGGGLYYFDTLVTGAALELQEVQLVNNEAGSSGGGLYAQTDGGTITVTSSQISDNTAGSVGGGLWVNSATSGQLTTLTESSVSGNTSSNGHGGGIYFTGSHLVLVRSAVVDNKAGGPAVVTATGGGIYADAQVDLTNSTVSGNQTEATGNSHGEGLFLVGGLSASFLHTTVASNTGYDPHAIYFDALTESAAVTFESSILDGGCALSGASLVVTTNGYNVERPASGSTTTCQLDASPGTDVITSDALLAPVANYGGPTQTQALFADSPAIALIPSCTLGVDQRNAPRPASNCDSGAFEDGATAPQLTVFADGFETGDALHWSSQAP